MATIDSNLRFAYSPSLGGKVGTAYSWYPNEASADFTVERTGVATRVNAQGLIEEVAPNVPRLDYSDGGSCPKLLTEIGVVNNCLNSESSANKTLTNSTLIDSGTQSIISGVNALIFSDNSTNGSHICTTNSVNTIVGNSRSFAVFVKKGSFSKVQLSFGKVSNWQGGNGCSVEFDLENVSATPISSTPSNYDIVEYSNGWYRCWISGTPTTDTNSPCNVFLVNESGNLNYEGNGDYVYLTGFMVCPNDILSSYIPTNGTTESRGDDQVYGAGDAETFNSVSGVLFADVKALGSGNRIMSLSSGTFANRIQLNLNTENNVVFQCSGQGVSVFPTDSDVDVFIQNKISFRWEDGNGEIWVNGVKKVVNTSFRSPASGFLQTLQLNQIGNTDVLQAKTKSVQHYNYLTDDEMEVLTGYTSYQDIANQFGFKTL